MLNELESQIKALENEKRKLINRQIEIEQTDWLNGRNEWNQIEFYLDYLMDELEDLFKQRPPKDLRQPLDDQHCWHCDPADDWNQIPF